ncbi:peptidylprolyl isomerase [Mucilaginibacter sp. RS28]|uniref:Peptidylprolyl isomerase n=1 Tax=Mucilaginibacter straminoryzae TaxID=2932774 RepID=A0A9X2BA57_9SPHI|nr:peptidylprolyl isomerase [Mucilaginibacter straminoryzae]MCJ8211409.1 peptidylprolyl isomerase [Mucilaginibacter straminoryzae]
MRKFGIALAAFLMLVSVSKAQRTLDKIAGVVGSSIILQSDIEQQYAQYIVQGGNPNPAVKCQVMQNLLTQKILAQQAVIDSVTVKEDEVDNEIERRMRSMIQRAGGQERLEQFLGRSVIQYKDEIRNEIRESMVADRMRGKITEKVSVTPLEVKTYFEHIPKDSIPTFNKEVEVGEIVFNPTLTKDEKAFARQKAEDLLQRIKKGEDFGNLARLYSQDPQSAIEGGDLGFFDRTTMVKEFTAWAFKLKAGEMSPVFESDFGFHFLQVIERRGEQVRARHILIIPQLTQASLDRAKLRADSVYNLLTKNKQVDFSAAAGYYSDDKETKYNGGMMLNAENVQSRTTFIPTDKLDPQVALVIDTMKVGGVSAPILYTGQDTKKSYRIYYLKSVVDAHKANLAQDFPKLKDAAYSDKLNRVVSQWFEKKRKENYIRIDNEYLTCGDLKKWVSTPQVAAK